MTRIVQFWSFAPIIDQPLLASLPDFATETATVDISGGSDLEITVTGSLTGDNSGGSHIRYKGTPSYMNINNTGGSTTAAAE